MTSEANDFLAGIDKQDEPLVNLDRHDLIKVLRRLPADLMKEMIDRPGKIFVAGGYIRAVIAGEVPNDIDVLGTDKDTLEAMMYRLNAGRKTAYIHRTDNAMTMIDKQRKVPVQAITRWVYPTPEQCVPSFDFTICQAVIFYRRGRWYGLCSKLFYQDLAAKRLRYTRPIREEEAGGSMLRVLKYYQRGYFIPIRDLAGVMERVFDKVRDSSVTKEEAIAGLLFEVDPLVVIDGVAIDEHNTAATEQAFPTGSV